MKKFLSILVVLTILLSVAIPVSTGAVSKVTGVKQTGATHSSFEISWSEYYGASYYKVEWCNTPNGTYQVDASYISGYKDTVYGRYAGTTYYVKVTPCVDNKYITSATSDPIAVTTAPNAVSNIKQTKATTSSLTISWTGSIGATSYKIYEESNNVLTYVGSSKSTSFTLNKLSNKKELPFYSLYVKAVRTVNGYDACHDYSSYITKYNLNLTPTKGKTPSISSYYNYNTSIYLKRPELEFQDGYNFKVYKANKSKPSYSLTNGTHVSGLKKGQFYKVKTRSYSNVGNTKFYGKWSSYKYFAAGVDKLKVKSRTKNSLKVSWSKVKGGKVSYDIYVSKSHGKGLKKFKKNYKKTSIKVTKLGKKRLSKSTYYYVYVKPKIKVGKKTYTSPIYSYTSAFTKY